MRKISTILVLLLCGCGHEIHRIGPKEKHLHTGRKYTIKNSHGIFKVTTQKKLIFDDVGIASYYSSGSKTATGEKFHPHHLTAAHPYLPLPSIAEVSLHGQPHKKVIVKINDRGPFTKHKRIIDLSLGAARMLDFVRKGLAKVRVKLLVKETLALREHGGNIAWKGECDFYEIYPRSK